MLKIRPDQIAVLAGPSQHTFEDSVAALVRRYWAEQWLRDGEGPGMERVRAAIAKARAAGFQAASDIIRFVNLTYALGPAFDTDPRYPWAALLHDRSQLPAARLDRVCQWAEKVLRTQEKETEKV
ncbi:MAG: hypothetical protein JNM66_03340 [Bryobacterales bacterium]|nr:hypothetical protein [Bryobacterales bacterium]